MATSTGCRIKQFIAVTAALFSLRSWSKRAEDEKKSSSKSRSRENRSSLLLFTGVALTQRSEREHSLIRRPNLELAVSGLRIRCASSKMTKSKKGASSEAICNSSKKRPRGDRALFESGFSGSLSATQSSFHGRKDVYETIHAAGLCRPVLTICLTAVRALVGSRISAITPNFSSSSLFHLDVSIPGHTTKRRRAFLRACSSSQMRAASMVFPNPTSSAIKRRSVGESINLSTGLNWYSRKSMRAASIE